MATSTTDALDALLYIHNGYATARWNFTDAVGTSRLRPGGIGNAVSLTYSFLASNPIDSKETGFRPLDALQQSAVRDVLDLIASVANIDFTKVGSQSGQITFGMSAQSGSSAYAYAPNFGMNWNGANVITSVSEDPFGGNVWINAGETWTASDWQPGGWGRLMLLHEVGHALGLKHPFSSGLNGTGYFLATELDNEAHTVMSYTSGPRTALPDLSGMDIPLELHASTLMPMDIEALQHLYGANTSWEAGRTVYAWAKNAELLETIWDGGGVDTIDCRNQDFSCTIDLRDGEYSSIGLRSTMAEIRAGLDVPDSFPNSDLPADIYNGRDNVAIAKGAIIENAMGGAGDDVLRGNTVANRLGGSGGADALNGAAGNDVLIGGAGADRLVGGGGRDVFDYNRASESSSNLARADVISGFVSGVDRIDLSTLDADAGLAGNQAFTFIGAADFSAAGQLRFADGVLYGSTDADTRAEFAIRLAGVAELAAADLVL